MNMCWLRTRLCISLRSRYWAEASRAACRLVVMPEAGGDVSSPAGDGCSRIVCRQFQDSQVHTFSSVFWQAPVTAYFQNGSLAAHSPRVRSVVCRLLGF